MYLGRGTPCGFEVLEKRAWFTDTVVASFLLLFEVLTYRASRKFLRKRIRHVGGRQDRRPNIYVLTLLLA